MKNIFQILASSKTFCYFCTVISWIANNELLVLIRGLALFIKEWRLPTFASDKLEIRNFKDKSEGDDSRCLL